MYAYVHTIDYFDILLLFADAHIRYIEYFAAATTFSICTMQCHISIQKACKNALIFGLMLYYL